MLWLNDFENDMIDNKHLLQMALDYCFKTKKCNSIWEDKHTRGMEDLNLKLYPGIGLRVNIYVLPK